MTERGGMAWGVRSKRESMYVYIWLVHVVMQQKLTLYCKAVTLQ